MSLTRLAVVLGAVAFLCAITAAASATTVHVGLALTAPGALNTLDLTLTADYLGMSASDSDAADSTGNVLADLSIDFDPTTLDATVLAIELAGGTVSLSDAHFTPSFGTLIGTITATATNLQATLDTPDPPGPVSGGSFDAADHSLIFNGGQLLAQGTGLVPLDVLDVDFGDGPIEVGTSGPGSIDVSLASVVGTQATYDVTLLFPVDFSQLFLGNDDVTLNLDGVGTLEAVGQFAVVVPEPASISMLGCGLIGLAGLRRMRTNRERTQKRGGPGLVIPQRPADPAGH